ncbi:MULTISPECIES: BTAD domain-containing putative transcriptional regulator [Actinoplanes]|uniref:AfsR/SARP family transcriptional regulator n=1 Tax=Actinoplanes TaxID=1865 RepID=UPI000696442C|nr:MULTISPECIES: BTAD domain-containing putative transcriptional regulator [Actinoplanes]GLY00673.1 hypothetical protein Acsp01_10520 [Actinoplanes sp. NBRC 101535]
MAAPVWFTALGGLRAWRDGREVDLGARQPRLVTALLLARGGHPVPVSELTGLLWTDGLPPSAVNVLHRHIGAIRRALEPGLARRAEGQWLLRRPGGYRLALPAASADLSLFRERAATAADGLRGGRPGEAIPAYREALALWTGRFADGLGAESHPLIVSVNRERSSVAVAAADATLGHGDHGDAEALLPALTAAVDVDPLDEPLLARLLLTLAAVGRAAEAIERFHHVRERIAADLGVPPGRELTAAVETILRRPAPLAGTGVQPPVPAQLPPGSALFVGRRAERALLTRRLEEGAEHTTGAVVLALDGLPGVGKTALAVRWAHEVTSRFPDGQLFLDLHGSADGEPRDPADALTALLTSLGAGISAPGGPDVAGQVALFRTVTAGRRLLILLDDARDAAQVRPLIPAAPGSLVLVTGRGGLDALAAVDGALLVTVDVPPPTDAAGQLLTRLGVPPPDDRAGRDAVASVLARTGRLPLALAVVAAGRPALGPVRLPEMADALCREPGLDAFAGADPGIDLRAVFDRSYRRLRPETARLFRRLSRSGAEIDPSSVPGAARSATVARLGELAGTGLLTRRGLHRYALHDLVRAYAEELADEHGPAHGVDPVLSDDLVLGDGHSVTSIASRRARRA